MKFSNEIIAKAKETKTVEELMALAKENGIELNEEDAKTYFSYLHPKTGELSDEELDNVAGGGCYHSSGNLLTTCGYKCKHYEEGRTSGVKGTCYRCKYWDNDPGGSGGGGSLWVKIMDVIMDVAAPRQCFHPANRKGN